MQIGIIGAGAVGTPLGRLWASAGHDVCFGSRSPDRLDSLLVKIGPRAKAGTQAEAAVFGDVILEAIPFGRVPDLPLNELQGKVLLSASNYFPRRDGQIDFGGLTQTAWIATQLPGVRIVKAFSMMGARVLERYADGDTQSNYAIFLAGDDAEAKATAAALVRDAGFEPADLGSLAESWVFESLTGPLFDARMTRTEAVARAAGLRAS